MQAICRTSRGRAARRRGFTLIELITAIGVIAIILFLFTRVFNDARTVVTRGKAVSQSIAQSRVGSDQFFRDAKRMLVYNSANPADIEGSRLPGFLVIAQGSFSNVLFPPEGADTQTTAPPPSGWTNTQDVRSDQLMFFIDADGLQATSPGADDRYDNLAEARAARIWYGHLGRLEGGNASDPGEGSYNLATELILGRQALLLGEENNTSPNDDAWAGGRYINASAPGYILTNRIDNWTSVFSEGNRPLWRAPSDVIRPFLAASTNGYETWFTDPPTFTLNETVYTNSALNLGAAVPNTALLLEDPFGVSGTAADSQFAYMTDAYKSSAMSWLFLEDGRRLVGTPTLDTATGGAAALSAANVAQTHPIFLEHVSEFIVEFAADIVDDVELDPATGQVLRRRGEALFVADGLPDGEPDTIPISNADPQPEEDAIGTNTSLRGAIKWYSAGNVAANPVIAGGVFGLIDLAQPIVWPVPKNGSLLPGGTQFIDGRNGNTDVYPPLVTTNTLPGGTIISMPYQTNTFVFGHTTDDESTPLAPAFPTTAEIEGEAKWWPYMIRIRYRLHDPDGDFASIDPASGQRVAGQWFEQIIPIPGRDRVVIPTP